MLVVRVRVDEDVGEGRGGEADVGRPREEAEQLPDRLVDLRRVVVEGCVLTEPASASSSISSIGWSILPFGPAL